MPNSTFQHSSIPIFQCSRASLLHYSRDSNLISIRGLRKWFDSRRGRVEALRGIDLEVTEKEFCVLLGPSGCGKTTMLALRRRFGKPDRENLEIDDSRCSNSADARNLCSDGKARYRHGVSVLRDLAAHERVSECFASP